MAHSIVPVGFECTSHKIFFEYINPLSEISIRDSIEEINSPKKQKKCSQEQDPEGRKQPNVDQPKSSLSTPWNSPSTLIPTSSSSDQDICSICLSSYENPVTLVFCHHSYCLNCLLLWLVKKQLCPLCKSCGNYFVQTNRYSSSSNHEIKVLSICSTTQKLSSTKVSRAIEVHRKRFPLQKKISSHCQNEEDSMKERRDGETWRHERAHRRYGGGAEDRRRKGVKEILEEEEVNEELEQISRELNETVERLHELDQKIFASQKKRKVWCESRQRRPQDR
jgi:hypothetical protein